MQNPISLKLENERAQGEAHKRSWNQTIKPFFDAKKAELYDAFNEVATSDSEMLMSIKMQHNVLTAMEDHFQHYINTGKLAETTLEEESNG